MPSGIDWRSQQASAQNCMNEASFQVVNKDSTSASKFTCSVQLAIIPTRKWLS